MKPEPQDEPGEANRFFLRKRLAPGMRQFPIQRLLKAENAAGKLPLYSTRGKAFISGPKAAAAAEAASLTWEWLGPGNIGGRTRALVFSPSNSNTIYAAGVAGGVWKSTDSGSNWTPMGDAMANMAVTALLVDPSNSNTIYAGTGEGFFNQDSVRGAGIFKSSDGGASWSQLSSTNTSDFHYINALAFDPGNSSIIYAATGTGLFQSRDSGSNWTQFIDASASKGCMDIVYRSDADTAVASCGTHSPTDSSSGIWRSTNASALTPTWSHIVGPSSSGASQALDNMGRISLAIAPSIQSTMYALIACSPSGNDQCGTGNVFSQGLLAVYKSTDGGATWGSAYTSTFDTGVVADQLLTNPEAQLCESTSGLNQGWYDNAIAVDPTNANRVFVSGVEPFRSDDGGATWGTIAYWWLPGANYEHADHHRMVFHPGYDGNTEKRIYDINDGGIFVSSDAATATKATSSTNVCPATQGDELGATWTSLNNGYGVTQFYHGSVYPGGTEYFAGAQDNGTVRGTDGNPNAWSEIKGGDGGFTAIDDRTSGNSTVLYAENTYVSIAKSTDDGGNFGSAVSGISNTGCGLFINPFQMDPNNPDRLFTTNNALWRTDTAASSWTQASAPISGTSCTNSNADSGERFSNYAVAPGNSDLLVAGTTSGEICRLTNATASGSTDSLRDCTQPAGPSVYVSDIAFDPNDNSKIYASVSTFGAAHVLKSFNSGQSWSDISGSSGSNPLPDAPADSVAVSPVDGNTIYVGTDIGVFVTSDGGANWARENTGFANVITDHLAFSPTGTGGLSLYAFTHGRGVFRSAVPNGIIFQNGFEQSTSLPNLVPYQPAGWSNKIVVSSGTGTTTDSPVYLTTDTLYVDGAVANLGTSSTSGTYQVALYVDDAFVTSFSYNQSLAANDYVAFNDYSIGTLSAGTHTIKIVADSTNAITELSESDNTYTKTIVVGEPNLTPYQPNGWSDKIVVSNVTGTNTDSGSLLSTDTLYIDWAVLNNGQVPTSTTFNTALYVDDVFVASWYTSPPLDVSYYTSVSDFSIGSLSPGSHTIKIVTDYTDAIIESDESDNTYTKTISVGDGGTLPNLFPYQPSGWSDKIVVSNVTGTNTDTSLSSTDTVYVDWAVGNGGTANAPTFFVAIYVDNAPSPTAAWTVGSLAVGYYSYVEDHSIGKLSAGTHSVKVVADYTDIITESNESDNAYTKTFTVGP